MKTTYKREIWPQRNKLVCLKIRKLYFVKDFDLIRIQVGRKKFSTAKRTSLLRQKKEKRFIRLLTDTNRFSPLKISDGCAAKKKFHDQLF